MVGKARESPITTQRERKVAVKAKRASKAMKKKPKNTLPQKIVSDQKRQRQLAQKHAHWKAYDAASKTARAAGKDEITIRSEASCAGRAASAEWRARNP